MHPGMAVTTLKLTVQRPEEKKSTIITKSPQPNKTHPNNFFSKGNRESQHIKCSSWNPELKDLLPLLDYTLQNEDKKPSELHNS